MFKKLFKVMGKTKTYKSWCNDFDLQKFTMEFRNFEHELRNFEQEVRNINSTVNSILATFLREFVKGFFKITKVIRKIPNEFTTWHIRTLNCVAWL